MRGRAIAILLLPLFGAAQACAQAAPSTAAAHDQLVAALRQVADRPLPAGDTLLTWAAQGLILFHTARVTPTEVETAMVRQDRLLGTATSTWVDTTWQAAHGEWREGDSVTRTWSAERRPDGLLVRADRDTMIATPALPWAVAEYGMDDQLVPLLRALSASGTPRALAVFRPYAMHWDTLTVGARDTAGVRVVTEFEGGRAVEVRVLPPLGGILAARRTDGSERRPLEGSPAYAQWQRRRPLLEQVGAAAP